MSDGTKIEWADATVNYVNGCSVVSPGCTNCYAMRLAGTRLKTHPTRAGLTRDTKAGPVWTGEVRAHEPALQQVLAWKRPRRIFWNAHGDLFHPNVPDEWIDRQFAVMALTPQHTHMVLTKRPQRMREYLSEVTPDGPRRFYVADAAGRLMEDGDGAYATVMANTTWPLPNVWLGTSVEDQARAAERIPQLLATPAAVRFLSAEPLLGPVSLDYFPVFGPDRERLLHWVIAGGESGPGARPMHPDWARGLRDQCAAAGVAFFFKQWGDWAPFDELVDSAKAWRIFDGVGMARVGKKAAGNLLDSRQHLEWPQ